MVSEEPKCQISMLIIMALPVQRQVKVSKQTNLVDGVDVGPMCM